MLPVRQVRLHARDRTVSLDVARQWRGGLRNLVEHGQLGLELAVRIAELQQLASGRSGRSQHRTLLADERTQCPLDRLGARSITGCNSSHCIGKRPSPGAVPLDSVPVGLHARVSLVQQSLGIGMHASEELVLLVDVGQRLERCAQRCTRRRPGVLTHRGQLR
ncbi:hypothetical protein J2X20_002124 [Pelomonas saccharophila]|uniref:Uncharacterized protein n=1 Tax=Roseateles saccharophilus TaxID=304 RepID=A0ABU1YMN5_ROSSA|nr:hypothetical protein [Roseateles saccharophilus]MDR7269495.1 hypothetical protein [Roseateles saccharophilus]